MKRKDRAGRDAERMVAIFAAPLAVGGDEVVFMYHAAC